MDAILSVFGGSESFEFQREIYCLLWVVVNSIFILIFYIFMSIILQYSSLQFFSHLNCASWKYDYKLKIIYSSAHSERDSYAVGNYWLLKNNICLISCSTCFKVKLLIKWNKKTETSLQTKSLLFCSKISYFCCLKYLQVGHCGFKTVTIARKEDPRRFVS